MGVFPNHRIAYCVSLCFCITRIRVEPFVFRKSKIISFLYLTVLLFLSELVQRFASNIVLLRFIGQSETCFFFISRTSTNLARMKDWPVAPQNREDASSKGDSVDPSRFERHSEKVAYSRVRKIRVFGFRDRSEMRRIRGQNMKPSVTDFCHL